MANFPESLVLRKGYRKISATCKQALEDDVSHAWVDTCCIDKTSSAELTESINSMYRWYYAAEICYAFLEDLQFIGDDFATRWNCRSSLSDASQREQIYQELLRRCRWFTRGWALQELLAPREVIFFDFGWNRIASRSELTKVLASITKIDHKALESRNAISTYSESRKMSWAQHRKTTRVEDRAYSLLGIFNVNMPLLYGEGDKAFTRLQEEIIRTSVDHSIFLHRPRDPFSETSLLATSPDDFADEPDIDWWREMEDDSSYQLTNQGLKIHLRLHQYWFKRNVCFAILNCKYKVDYTGPLALVLSTSDNHRSELDDVPGLLSTPTVFSIGLQVELLGTRRRTYQLPIDTLENAEYRSIVILRHSLEANPFQTPRKVLKTWLSPAPGYQGRSLDFTQHYPPWRWTHQRIFDSKTDERDTEWEPGKLCIGHVVCDGPIRFRLVIFVSTDDIVLTLLQAPQDTVPTDSELNMFPFFEFSSESSLKVDNTLVRAYAVTTSIMGESFHKITISVKEHTR